MRILEAAAAAFSLYSALPMPQAPWRESSLRYALCAFPLVGVVIGLAWWGWCALCGYLAFPPLLRGAGLCLLPVVITGGIHLDGYADTWDALASHAPPEKKREILHDPHCGAFAVVHLCGYYTVWFALCASLRPNLRALTCMGLAFVLSRALSALALTVFPLSPGSGMAKTLSEALDPHGARRFLLSVSGILSAILCAAGGWCGIGMTAAALAALLRYYRTAVRAFGGTSGDLAGWFLQTAELWMLGALVLGQYAGGAGCS